MTITLQKNFTNRFETNDFYFINTEGRITSSQLPLIPMSCYLLVPVKQADPNHNCPETKPFHPGKFIMKVKYSNLKMPKS